jgi:hypothetical protein
MSFKCKIGLHSWNGCRCSVCGKTKDEQHDWSEDNNKCSICGKICDNPQPCEKNSKCDKSRDNLHTWEGSKCTQCGKTLKTHSNGQADIPWDYIQSVSSDNEDFFSKHKESFPGIYSKMAGMGHDPVLMLVAMDQEKWCALLALLYKRQENLFIIPEVFTKSKPKFFNNGYCDVYIPPKVDGVEMQACIFGLEREWLISEFCWVKGIPPMFISLIKADKAPAGSVTIVVLASKGMCVRHLPLNTPVIEQETPSPSQISMDSSDEIKLLASMLDRSLNAENFTNAIKTVGYKYKEESFLGQIFESESGRILLNVKAHIHPTHLATALYLDKNNNKQTYLVENGIRS